MTIQNRIKIIGLNGSPKRNRSIGTLRKRSLEGCKKAGVEVNLIYIKDYSIKYCQGCHKCLHAGRCAINDDVGLVCEKLNNSDGSVVGFPVYSGEPTALLKTLEK